MRSRQEEDKATAAAAGRSAGVQDGYLPLAEQAVEGVGVKQRLVEVASLIVAHLRGRRVANELLRALRVGRFTDARGPSGGRSGHRGDPGLVPEFFERVPDYLLDRVASFKSLQLSDQAAIPNRYKELIGLAVSGA
jgi:hypothetical protein